MKKITSILTAISLVLTTLMSTVTAVTLSQEAYLSNLTPLNATVGWGSLHMDTSVEGNPITLLDGNGNEVTYDKGIGTHSDSVITYDISEYTAQGYNVFDCFVGLDTECLPSVGTATFSVSLDGQTVCTTSAIRTDEEAQRLTLDISGAKELTLSATASNNSFSHADWAEAKLAKSSDADFTSTKYELVNKGKSWLNVGDTTDIDVNYVKGYSPYNLENDNQVSYSSSDTSVVTVDGQGKVYAVASGSAIITATYSDGNNSGSLTSSVYVEGNGIKVSSPNGNVKAEISLDLNGTLKYAVAYGDEVVINQSDMGINTSVGDFRNGLSYSSHSTAKVEETYYMHSGKAEFYSENAYETTIDYTKNGKTFKVIVNLADDSFAYRYVINGESSFTVTAEASSFTVPQGSAVYCCDYEAFYENYFEEIAIENLSGSKGMCFLYETSKENLVLINEADMSGNYCGSALNVSGGVATVTPVDGTIYVTGDFETPWRVAVIGDAETIVNCQTFENLSDPNVVSDADSWVISEVTSWDWLTSQINNDPEEFKIYIDQAAEMEWGYLLMDDGWAKFDENETIILPDWLGEVVTYANDRGIEVLAWLDNKYVNTKEKAETNLKILANNGIKGIKVDFFNSESQATIQNMLRISEICADYHLLVNMHGANKPTGERRTYPHVLTREGVFGCEYGGGTNAYNNVLLPLARGAVGPADFTPQLLARDGQYTTNQSSAMPIISESGIMCISTYTEEFDNSILTQWLKDIPSRWHDTKLVNVDIGNSITLARRYEDRWYMSAITVGATDMSLSLDFLDDNATYLATVFYDTDDVDVSGVRYELVQKGDIINVSLKENGGANIRLDKQYTIPTAIEFADSTMTVAAGLDAFLEASIVGGNNVDIITYTSADESIVKVSSNGQTAIIKGQKEGETTVTATINVEGNVISKSIAISVLGREIDGKTNLALDKNVINDSVKEGTSAANATDGDLNSYWQSNSLGTNNENWAHVGVEFGTATEFDAVRIHWHTAASVNGYKVEYSTDGKSFYSVSNQIISREDSTDVVIFDSVYASYIRLNISGMEGKGTNPAVYELQVYNSTEAIGFDKSVNLSLTANAIDSGAEAYTSDNNAAASVDGDMSTGWQYSKSIGDLGEVWLGIELEKESMLEKTVISWETATKATEYEVQYSYDGITWYDTYAPNYSKGSDVNGTTTDTVTFAAITARYLRVSCTAAQNAKFSPKIWEFEVYA